MLLTRIVGKIVTTRSYFAVMGAVYLWTGFGLAFLGNRIALNSPNAPLSFDGLHQAYAVLFLATGIMNFVSAFVDRREVHVAAVMASTFTGTFWALLLIVSAMTFGGDIIRPASWIGLSFVTYGVLPRVALTDQKKRALENGYQERQDRSEHLHRHAQRVLGKP